MKTFIAIVTIFFIAIGANAQTENTNERLITQLKNGTAPGLLFSKNVPAAKVDNKAVEQKESLIAQIRKGTAPGMKFMTGTGGSAALRTSPTVNRAQAGTLASELEIKKEALKTIAAPPPIPTQEEIKNEAPAKKQ